MPAHFDFCASLINASVVNGTLVTHSAVYSPYCDPCLRVRTVTPQPFNHSALTLHDNNMTGSISNWTGIGALNNLTWIDFSWNKISGSLRSMPVS